MGFPIGSLPKTLTAHEDGPNRNTALAFAQTHPLISQINSTKFVSVVRNAYLYIILYFNAIDRKGKLTCVLPSYRHKMHFTKW